MDSNNNYTRRRRSRAPTPSPERHRRDKYRVARSPETTIIGYPHKASGRDRSRSPVVKDRRGHGRSRSPAVKDQRGGHGGNRAYPQPSNVLGVFGLSEYTTESHVREIFSKFGSIEKLKMIYDSKTGRSRGFAFVYYCNAEDARVAKDQCSSIELDGQRIRVDFSLTVRPHSPTPGVYMGRPSSRKDGMRGERDNYSDNYIATSKRRRSPSPQYGRRRNRSASRHGFRSGSRSRR